MNSFNGKSTQMTSFCVLLFNLYFFFCLLISVAHFPLTCHGCHEQDRRALLDFKFFLSDPANRLSSWNVSYQNQNCCNWQGVGCSYDSFRVISINLRNTAYENYYLRDYDHSVGFNPPNTSLTGKFSPSLFNVSHLEYIDLAYNDFQGTQIPVQLSNLTKLSHLDLSESNVSSLISTQFNNLSSLHYLDLSGNTNYYYLQSSSLKWLRGLLNLQVLNLSRTDLINQATSSEDNFAEHILHLSNLEELDISRCGISSTTFPNFHNLSFLSSLNMNYNELSSKIPEQLANLTSLSTLYLLNCGLQGFVPYLPQLKELDVSDNPDLNPDLTWMFRHPWPKLQKLTISKNNMSGSIPSSISNAPLLVSLSADGCSIQGSLPSSIYNLSQLQSLDLSNNNITGYIQSSISNLKFLTSLDLSGNIFQGSLPKSISNLKFLTFLDLFNNKFQGFIPKSISNLKSLNILRLSYNDFQGPIPESISNLKFLNILDLSGNKIRGSIPSSICKILSLEELSLEINNITGTIPSCIYKLHNLTFFSVRGNSIGGSVSLISLINLNLTSIDLLPNRVTVVIDQNFSLNSESQLQYLVLPSCNLTGLFHTFICKLTHLKELNLSHNHMTGVIPSCISELKNLRSFDVSNNQLSGPLPLPPKCFFDVSNNKLSGEISIEIGKRLDQVSLTGNDFSGSIPSSICSKGSQSNPVTIDLSNNKFSGVIPNTLRYCRGLISLNLRSNKLTGNLPNGIGRPESLIFLQLQDNYLDGSPLNLISKLQGLVVLNLANNQFEGSIPRALFGPYSRLTIISLRSNKFSGSIPEEISNLYRLQILDLSRNKLSGHIPKQLGWYWMELTGNSEMLTDVVYDIQLKMVINGIMLEFQTIYNYMSGLDLSCNMLDGNIPTEIGRLNGLQRLNLSHNNFSDSIPTSIGDMSNLVSLDLSFNRLSGKIPQSLTSIDFLGFLNLSYNELSGQIPQGIHFGTLSVDGWAFVGNALLCGEPTKQVCEVEKDSQEDDQEDASEKLILYSIVSLGFIVGFWGLFFVMLIKKEKWWFPYWKFIDIIVAIITKMY